MAKPDDGRGGADGADPRASGKRRGDGIVRTDTRGRMPRQPVNERARQRYRKLEQQADALGDAARNYEQATERYVATVVKETPQPLPDGKALTAKNAAGWELFVTALAIATANSLERHQEERARREVAEREARAAAARCRVEQLVSDFARPQRGAEPDAPWGERRAAWQEPRDRAPFEPSPPGGPPTSARQRHAWAFQGIGDFGTISRDGKPAERAMAEAQLREAGQFEEEQRALRDALAKERSPGKQEAIRLRQAIEAAEYSALQYERIARIGAEANAPRDHPDVTGAEAEARTWEAKARELEAEWAKRSARDPDIYPARSYADQRRRLRQPFSHAAKEKPKAG